MVETLHGHEQSQQSLPTELDLLLSDLNSEYHQNPSGGVNLYPAFSHQGVDAVISIDKIPDNYRSKITPFQVFISHCAFSREEPLHGDVHAEILPGRHDVLDDPEIQELIQRLGIDTVWKEEDMSQESQTILVGETLPFPQMFMEWHKLKDLYKRIGTPDGSLNKKDLDILQVIDPDIKRITYAAMHLVTGGSLQVLQNFNQYADKYGGAGSLDNFSQDQLLPEELRRLRGYLVQNRTGQFFKNLLRGNKTQFGNPNYQALNDYYQEVALDWINGLPLCTVAVEGWTDYEQFNTGLITTYADFRDRVAAIYPDQEMEPFSERYEDLSNALSRSFTRTTANGNAFGIYFSESSGHCAPHWEEVQKQLNLTDSD